MTEIKVVAQNITVDKVTKLEIMTYLLDIWLLLHISKPKCKGYVILIHQYETNATNIRNGTNGQNNTETMYPIALKEKIIITVI